MVHWKYGMALVRDHASTNRSIRVSRDRDKEGEDMEKLEQVSSEGETDSLEIGRSMEWKYTHISEDEEDLIIRLHRLLGDRWSLIAGRLPWRTKEEIEKYWNLRSNGIDSSESSD